MYERLDTFLSTNTWDHLNHDDEMRFFQALDEIVAQDGFNPDAMGEYMATKLGLPDGTDSAAIDHYVAAAWAVKRYLQSQRGSR
jgi:hypothetical protein